MALDKLVDSTQLDSDLTSVANAIRTKGGTSAQLAFPAGFVSAIGDLSTGTGYSVSAVMAQGTEKIFTTDDLSVVKRYLTVTVTYSDQSAEVLPADAYTLSGTLTAGYSTITVTALGVTTTVSVHVTAATDVTPDFAAVNGYAAQVAWESTTHELSVIGVSQTAYAQGYVSSLHLRSGYRYRITAKVNVLNSTTNARITFMNTSNSATIATTNYLTADGDLYYDGIPSDSSAFMTTPRLNLYIAWTSATQGAAAFKDVKVIEYSDADANELLNIMMGGQSA